MIAAGKLVSSFIRDPSSFFSFVPIVSLSLYVHPFFSKRWFRCARHRHPQPVFIHSQLVCSLINWNSVAAAAYRICSACSPDMLSTTLAHSSVFSLLAGGCCAPAENPWTWRSNSVWGLRIRKLSTSRQQVISSNWSKTSERNFREQLKKKT